jgi:hypothetical protein
MIWARPVCAPQDVGIRLALNALSTVYGRKGRAAFGPHISDASALQWKDGSVQIKVRGSRPKPHTARGAARRPQALAWFLCFAQLRFANAGDGLAYAHVPYMFELAPTWGPDTTGAVAAIKAEVVEADAMLLDFPPVPQQLLEPPREVVLRYGERDVRAHEIRGGPSGQPRHVSRLARCKRLTLVCPLRPNPHLALYEPVSRLSQ